MEPYPILLAVLGLTVLIAAVLPNVVRHLPVSILCEGAFLLADEWWNPDLVDEPEPDLPLRRRRRRRKVGNDATADKTDAPIARKIHPIALPGRRVAMIQPVIEKAAPVTIVAGP